MVLPLWAIRTLSSNIGVWYSDFWLTFDHRDAGPEAGHCCFNLHKLKFFPGDLKEHPLGYFFCFSFYKTFSPFESQTIKDYDIQKLTHLQGNLESPYACPRKQNLRKDKRRSQVFISSWSQAKTHLNNFKKKKKSKFWGRETIWFQSYHIMKFKCPVFNNKKSQTYKSKQTNIRPI